VKRFKNHDCRNKELKKPANRLDGEFAVKKIEMIERG
jgi:hypothetical protein